MITQTGVDNMWNKGGVQARYKKIERARPYATTPDARRFLVWLWTTCERLDEKEPGKLFEWALKQFADQCSINVLQPKPPTELQPPVRWKDLWGHDLPNPFDRASPDLKAQTLLTQRAPELAKWLKAFAESPYSASCAWQDEQAAILKKQALDYNSDTHLANPFVNGANDTDKAQFVKNASPEVVERAKWEAKPIEFPSAGKHFDLTKQSKISTIPRLSAIWDAMVEQEREYVASEKVTLQRQRLEAEQRLKALEGDAPQPLPPRMVGRAKIGAE